MLNTIPPKIPENFKMILSTQAPKIRGKEDLHYHLFRDISDNKIYIYIYDTEGGTVPRSSFFSLNNILDIISPLPEFKSENLKQKDIFYHDYIDHNNNSIGFIIAILIHLNLVCKKENEFVYYKSPNYDLCLNELNKLKPLN